jgi:MOSC domain-containing protein YiiM
MKGIIVALSISDRRGIPKRNVETVQLLEGYGIEGDAHAGNWHRQVSILALESIEKMMKTTGLKLRPGIFAENITTKNLDTSKLKIGDRITIGEAELEVTQIGKECHKPCAIFRKVGDCIMPKEGIFARVVKGGNIKVGDECIVHRS